MQFGTQAEQVTPREEFSLEKARKVLQNEVIAILGYGVQGPAQALNLRDHEFQVIIGQRPHTPSWQKAEQDGWIPGTNLFSIEEACEKGSFICNLLSDAGQMQTWKTIERFLNPKKTLCFSHGFSVTFHQQTAIIPPPQLDVILVAPKGSGRSVRKLFLAGKGINSSYAIYQDATGKAEEKALAFGIGIGSGYLFKTTFEKEVYSDLVGERGVLMGALAGVIAAQYDLLRKKGHAPSEAFNETVEELTQSLVPLVAENGMDWMYQNCSTTAQRGALDWMPRFKNAVTPVFEALYESVASGKEAQIVLSENSKENYREKLERELEQMKNEEIWQVGSKLRKLRP